MQLLLVPVPRDGKKWRQTFYKKALPQLNSQFKVTSRFIRGNVDTRLRKLDNSEYDGIILATAGLNRLLRSETDAAAIINLLQDKLLMLLPLIECVPAPCQGAIVAEANPLNEKAVEVLKKINDENLFADCYAEKKEAIKYGAGCIQKFGVTTIETKNEKYLYAAGKDAEGTGFVKWNNLPGIKIEKDKLFSTTDTMKDFFDYAPIVIGGNDDKEIKFDKPVVFIANYKAIQKSSVEPIAIGLLQLDEAPSRNSAGFRFVQQQKSNSNSQLGSKIILASGTKTWFELAKKGYWVTASADALGFEFLLPSLQMPLLNILPGDISILTHEDAAKRWRKKGYDTVSNYKLLPKSNEVIQQAITEADSIFWSSFSQFEFYGKYAKENAKHLCAGGETAELLKEAGIEPIIFPTIKSFQQWRNSSIRSHSVA